MKILGIFFGRNKKECEVLNWNDKVKKIKQILNLWRHRDLTIQGRAVVINTMLMSKLWYSLSVLSMPKWARDSIQKECIQFLWNYGAHLVSYKTIVGDKHNGGLMLNDIYLKMLSFRLKFLAKYFCTSKDFLWKHILKYHLSKICSLGANSEIFLLRLFSQDLPTLPQFYKEMFSAWYAIEDYVIFNQKESDVYNFCLFCNPKVTNKGKMLKWNVFIKAGVTHVKHIAYEVIPGFLPSSYIVDIIQEYDPDVNVLAIKENYRTLLESIPREWTEYVKEKEFHNMAFLADFCVKYENQSIVFSTCTVKIFYKLLIHKLFQHPVSNSFWKEKFNIDDSDVFFKRWGTLLESYKPPEIIELDFKMYHNAIFTYEKLFKIGKTESNCCPICSLQNEDIIHLFIGCNELHEFINKFVVYHLETLFKDVDVNIFNTLRFDEMFFSSLSTGIKNVNTFFVNFFLSICRLSIYKRRQLFIKSQQKMDVTKFCKYMLRQFISYNHYQLCIKENRRNIFSKLFLNRNPLVKETEGVLVFIF